MLQKIKNNRSQAGFTLIELLIVIVIIAILAVLAISVFSDAQADARDAQRQADIKQVKTQLELYYSENGHYPTTTEMQGAVDTVAGASGILEGLGPEALTDPSDDSGGNSFAGVTNPTTGVYGYVATASEASGAGACDNLDTATGVDCASYTLSYFSEQEDAPKTIEDVSGE